MAESALSIAWSTVERPSSARATAAAIRNGTRSTEAIDAAVAALRAAGYRPDYLALRNAETLAETGDEAGEPLRLLVAAWLGKTRLIDNIAV